VGTGLKLKGRLPIQGIEKGNILTHTIVATQQRTPMWVYERNYHILLKLLPDLVQQAVESRYRVRLTGGTVTVTLLEKGPYTQMVELVQSPVEDLRHVEAIHLKVRIYHDASLAEVIAYQGRLRLMSKYEYPNKHMYQPDEKQQSNYLLHEWLSSMQASDYQSDVEVLCSDR